MSLFVKVCGVTDARAIDACTAAGVDAVGFVFAHSPRRLEEPRARELAGRLRPDILRFAVFRRPGPHELRRAVEAIRAHRVQADLASASAIELPPGIDLVPVIRDGPAAEAAARRLVTERPDRPPVCLFDAARSGKGMRADWRRAARLARSTRLILAGGLDPANVADAVRLVRPWGVDVSSGVESRTGVKDARLIRAFVSAARAAASDPREVMA